MASPITPSTTNRALSLTPGARVLQSPLSDETIWKRLKEAGFDEESIKRRDKAALIGYIANLEAEMFDLQHHMGLLILERKELVLKYDQIKSSAEAAELSHKRDQAAHLSALAEANKREESLKKALGVEKECISSIEKALHEMRTECAETKVAAECKLVEAHNMIEEAHKKSIDAEAKLNAAEALEAEANRYHRSAERKLQEFEAREDDLSRRISDFKADCDAKEKEISLERQTLSERRKILQQEHERLLDAQALLNQREDYIANKSQELNRQEKEVEASKSRFEKELKALNDEKSKLELTLMSISQREEAVNEREALLNKREQELLVLQEKIASKESVEIQKVVFSHETVLRTREAEFEAELEKKWTQVEDEIEAKRRSWELKEFDIGQREALLLEREHDLEVQARALIEKEKDVTEKLKLLDEKERSLSSVEKDINLRTTLLQQEKEGIIKMKLDLQKSLESLENRKKQVDYAKEKLESMKCETNELSFLEKNIKEEVEILRDQRLALSVEKERLEGEKAKFEAEWELIDDKREELRREAEWVAKERDAVTMFLKNERDSLRLEKEAMRDQHKHDVESLNREREEFMNRMMQERSEWFNKIQQEHVDFLLGIEMQKRELESSIEKRREEVESYLRDKEKELELERRNELHHVNSLREKAEKELDQIALEMKKLETERQEINLDRERRDNEQSMLNKSIEDLKVQTYKLEKQRESLHAEREEISAQMERLKKLEDLKLALDRMEVAEMHVSSMESSQRKIFALKQSKQHRTEQGAYLHSHNGNGLDSPHKLDVASTPTSARFSWIKRYTDLLFKNSPDKPDMRSEEKSPIPDHEHVSMLPTGNLESFDDFRERQHIRYAFVEPKVILEVRDEGEITKGTDDTESNMEEDASIIRDSISDQELQAGRKRRVTNFDIDPLPAKMPRNKKRRQQESAAPNMPEDNQCVSLTQASVPENLHVTEKSTDVPILEKTINITEMISDKTETDNIPNAQQNSEGIYDHDVIKDGGRNDLSSIQGENSKIPHDSEAAEIAGEEQLETNGHGAEHTQTTEGASVKDDSLVEDTVVKKSAEMKDIEGVGKRTRSRQKPQKL